MRIDDLQVELRPRSPWEAIELGMALVRRHAGAVWRPWWLLTLPVFALVNAVAWWLDAVPVAALVMWWLKPVFDRIPLFVLSRAVFGAAPGVRETLAAQRRWGWRPMPGYLTWRRPGMARALYLPVDLLEGGPKPGARRRVIGGQARGVAVMLTVACLHFEAALALGAIVAALVFVPVEFLSESARAIWTLVTDQPPRWAQLALNAVVWLATSLIEPFYVGAGLALYLNRRTQLEAWDVEIAFRRMRRRLQAAASMAMLVLACALCLPARAAAPAPPRKEPAATPLAEVFGPELAPDAGFRRAVRQAYTDPLLSPRERRSEWRARNPKAQRADGAHPVAEAIARAIGLLGEYGLWILGALGVVALLRTLPRWWPWLRDAVQPPTTAPTPVVVEPLADVQALPDDVPAAARALWREGRPRKALALLYRASVRAMSQRTGTELAPGATEAECLRAARALREPEDRQAFADAVRVWQYAAYAERLPGDEDFDRLLLRLSQRFGWAA